MLIFRQSRAQSRGFSTLTQRRNNPDGAMQQIPVHFECDADRQRICGDAMTIRTTEHFHQEYCLSICLLRAAQWRPNPHRQSYRELIPIPRPRAARAFALGFLIMPLLGLKLVPFVTSFAGSRGGRDVVFPAPLDGAPVAAPGGLHVPFFRGA